MADTAHAMNMDTADALQLHTLQEGRREKEGRGRGDGGGKIPFLHTQRL